MINTKIAQLVNYGIKTGLIEEDDKICITNNLLEALSLTDYVEPDEVPEAELEDILGGLLDYAVSAGIIEDSTTYRDLFDTRLMGILTPRPSVVRKTFKELYEEDPVKATDWYYKLSCDTDYIRRYRIKKDMKWVTSTEYGDIDITVNEGVYYSIGFNKQICERYTDADAKQHSYCQNKN